VEEKVEVEFHKDQQRREVLEVEVEGLTGLKLGPMEQLAKEIRVEMELVEVEPQVVAVAVVEKEVLEEMHLDQALQETAVLGNNFQYLEPVYSMQQVVEVEPIYTEALELLELVVLV
jgi:hypothetical protein